MTLTYIVITLVEYSPAIVLAGFVVLFVVLGWAFIKEIPKS
jgi:hypothetical protein